MPDYNNGKIYKLWSPEGIEIYIGSTTRELYKRKSEHKNDSNKCISKLLFEKYDDVRIELIEYCPCNNKEELEKKEGEHIRKNTECVNMLIAGRTQKEYREDNIEHKKEYNKEYYQDNKEHKEKCKEYYENNKEYMKEYYKERYEKNKEQKKEHSKEYYENNKQKILEQRSQLYLCECGRTVRFSDKAIHFKSKIHQRLLFQQLG